MESSPNNRLPWESLISLLRKAAGVPYPKHKFKPGGSRKAPRHGLGLKQPTRTTPKAATQIVKRAPTRVYGPETTNHRVRTTKSGAIMSGCEILGPMMRTAASTNLQLIPCNPVLWAATRAQRMAHLYSYYVIRHMALKYKPAVGTDVDGTIICSTLALTDKVGTGEDAQILLTKNGSMMTAAWQECVGVSREPMPYKMYMMGTWGAPTEGSFYLACLDNFATATVGATLGQLLVEYEIEMISPSMSSTLNLQFDQPISTTVALVDGASTTLAKQQGSFLVSTKSVDGGDLGTYPGDVWQVAKEAGSNLVWRLIRNGVQMAVEEFSGSLVGYLYGKQNDW